MDGMSAAQRAQHSTIKGVQGHRGTVHTRCGAGRKPGEVLRARLRWRGRQGSPAQAGRARPSSARGTVRTPTCTAPAARRCPSGTPAGGGRVERSRGGARLEHLVQSGTQQNAEWNACRGEVRVEHLQGRQQGSAAGRAARGKGSAWHTSARHGCPPCGPHPVHTHRRAHPKAGRTDPPIQIHPGSQHRSASADPSRRPVWIHQSPSTRSRGSAGCWP